MLRIGLISDTHGQLRPEATVFLGGCDHIIHAGDVGTPEVLEALARIAPVTAVRGNNDSGSWADALGETTLVRFGEILIYAIHDIALLDIDPSAACVHVVISGHSHRPKIERRAGVIYVNPGSAGRRRFKLPIALGELLIDDVRVVPQLAQLIEPGIGGYAAFVRCQ